MWPGHKQMWISLEIQHTTAFQEVWELGAKSPKYTSLQTPELCSRALLVRCHLPSFIQCTSFHRPEDRAADLQDLQCRL